ncbi:hypothetical protein [Micromonospora sp. NPDC048830]|uniref:hypothetical protein n=1 Tax=Micromonospora sp. NPDC048830 TaxID=3364257 RepID=UPI0037178334
MAVGEDGERLAASLADRLDAVGFTNLTTDQVTARLIDEVADWAGKRGWRVYRRAASVLPLPPPMSAQQSVLDVACARPDGPPVVVEIDHGTRRRTWEKLLAEADAGRVALWVRWGAARFTAPPPPIRMVTCEVSRRPDPTGQGRVHSRLPRVNRLPPAHSTVRAVAAVELPLLPPPELPGGGA